jgi:uncharacterized protein YbjT (DUF2867 family)
VVPGDLDDEASLRRALDGAWGAVGVQNTWEAGVEREEDQGKRFARAVKDAGVRHFLYQSVGSAHRETGIPHFDNKWRIEQSIRELGIPSWTILRPAFFMENFLGPWFKPYLDQGTLAIGIKPETKLQMIAVRDIGKYGRAVFERHAELNGRDVDISGDELSGPEMAAVIGEITGRRIDFHQVPIEQVRAGSEDAAAMYEWFDEVGYNADIDEHAREFGIRPTRFREWAKEQRW